ncbi:hypothetical protein P8452_47267 [Trifolium repens]|nr:hypothetical protein P8452_47267 [Trifolium repens]
MMKSSYSFQLKLLIFLLITANTTHAISARFLPGVIQLGKFLGGQAIKSIWKNKIDIIQSLTPPQGKNVQIEDLDLIKQYLFHLGYLQQNPPYDISLDKKTKSAIEAYQKKFNLQDNGFLLNSRTLQQILLPRCGVPDVNFEYTLGHKNNAMSWPKGNKWFSKDTKFLTYGFAPSNIPSDMKEVFKNALMRWSTRTNVLTFMEVTSYDDANIKIGLYEHNFNDVVQDVVLGDTVISLQLNSGVKSGEIRFDASKYWVLPTNDDNTLSLQDEKIDFETMAMHQIGHLLGLDHSFETDSIMYPIIKQRKVTISNSDITNMH